MNKTSSFLKVNTSVPFILGFLMVLNSLLCIFTFSKGINSYDLHDYIEGVFWAEATLKSKSLINPDYVYYYIVPFGSNIMMAPFVALFGTTMLANQLGMIVYLIVYLAVIFRLSGSLYSQMKHRLVFCCVTSLFIFTYIGDNLLHHMLSYGIGFVCFLGELSCLIDIRNGKNEKRSLILAGILALWAASNGVVTAALSTVPVMAGLIWTKYRSGTLLKKDSLKTVLMFTGLTALGIILYKICDMKAISLDMYEARFLMADAEQLITNLTHGLFLEYLRIFYFNPPAIPVFTLNGIFYLVKLLFASSVIILPVWLYVKGRKEGYDFSDHEDRCFIAAASFTMILISLAQYVVFRRVTQRYLFNGILCVFLLLAVLFTDRLEKTGKMTGVYVLFLFVLMYTGKMLVFTYPESRQNEAVYRETYKYLKEKNLTYGYTVGRNYQVINLYSEGEYKVYKVDFDEEADRYYISYDRIYLDELKKPEGIDRFYIIRNTPNDTEKSRFVLLENTYSEKTIIGNNNIYVYPIEDWEKVMIEK